MSPIRTTRFTFPRRMLTFAFIGLISTCVLAYILFQARFLLEGPQIALTNAPDAIQYERQVMLEGTAANITTITLNGRAIVTDETGVFREPVILENGYTTIRIDAYDRYGRTTAIERSFVYTPNGTAITLQNKPSSTP